MSIHDSQRSYQTFVGARAIIACAILAALLTWMQLGILSAGAYRPASWSVGARLVDTSPTPLGCGGVTAGCH